MTYLTRDELKRILMVAYDTNRSHHLFMVIALTHALRVSEALAIRGVDIERSPMGLCRLPWHGVDTFRPQNLFTPISPGCK
jgi:integrase